MVGQMRGELKSIEVAGEVEEVGEMEEPDEKATPEVANET